MMLRSGVVPQVTLALVELALLVGSIVGSWSVTLDGLVMRRSRLRTLASQPEESARVFRYFRRETLYRGMYDSVGTSVDVPVFVLEMPVGTGSVRALSRSDLGLIDQVALNAKFSAQGLASLADFAGGHPMPYMTVKVRALAKDGCSLLTLVGFERLDDGGFRCALAVIMFFVVAYFVYSALRFAWGLHFGNMVCAFIGVHPTSRGCLVLNSTADSEASFWRGLILGGLASFVALGLFVLYSL